MILSWSIGLVLRINRMLDRTFIVSSLIDRTLSWSIGLMHYDRLNKCTRNRSYFLSNIHFVKFNWSNSITIDQTNALGSIGCSIDQSNMLGSIRSSINPMILWWSIKLVLMINRMLNRTFTVSSLIDGTLSRSIILMH
jgi:hypothetical protein